LINALIFFVVWLFILYAGADHPPPSGFIMLIVFDILAAGLIYWRVPTYITWFETRKSNRLLYVLRDGVAAGFAFAVLALLLPGTGEPSNSPLPIDYLIWFIVLGAVGLMNAVIIYSVNALIKNR
jgi:membrane protease YdiL (CAAX protease family)